MPTTSMLSFTQHRYAVQRAAQFAGGAFGIEAVCVVQRVGIQFDDGVQRGTRRSIA